MSESVTPLIAAGVVIVLFIVLLSVLTSNYSLNGIKSKTVGDGQHRTARWATTQEIKNTHTSLLKQRPGAKGRLSFLLSFCSFDIKIHLSEKFINFRERCK